MRSPTSQPNRNWIRLKRNFWFFFFIYLRITYGQIGSIGRVPNAKEWIAQLHSSLAQLKSQQAHATKPNDCYVLPVRFKWGAYFHVVVILSILITSLFRLGFWFWNFSCQNTYYVMFTTENNPKCVQSGIEETLTQICVDQHTFEIKIESEPLDWQ